MGVSLGDDVAARYVFEQSGIARVLQVWWIVAWLGIMGPGMLGEQERGVGT